MANTLAAFKPDAWAKSLVTKLDRINVMMPLVNRDWEGDLSRSKLVKIRTAGNITMSTYDPNADIVLQDLAPTSEDFTVADFKYFAFAVDDTDDIQSDINAIGTYTQRAVVAFSNTIDAKLMGAYTYAHANNRITGASSAAIALTSNATDGTAMYSVLVKARTALGKQFAPMEGRFVVLSSYEVGLLLEDTRFTKASDLGDRVVMSGMIGKEFTRASDAPGFVGRAAGFDIYESNSVIETGGARFLPFGVRGAISYASQLTKIRAMEQEKRFGIKVDGLLVHDTYVPAEASKALGYIKATIV